MKLLVVSQYFYPEQFRVSDVCFQLAELGHDITVLTGLPNYPMGEIFEGFQWTELEQNGELHGYQDPSIGAFIHDLKGVKVIRCPLSPRKSGKMNLVRNYFSFAYQASKIAKKMCKVAKSSSTRSAGKFSKVEADYDLIFDFDKILVFQYSPVTMAIPAMILKNRLPKKFGHQVPLLLYCFDLWPESIVSAGLPNHGPIYWAILQLSKWIYKGADQILISSKNFKKYFNAKIKMNENIFYLPIYAEELFSITENIVSEAPRGTLNDCPLHNSAQKGYDKDCIHLLFAGNIGKMQSVETIVLAASEIEKNRSNNPHLPKILFHIVGDGSAFEENKVLANSLGLTNTENPVIIFHGRHPLEDMPGFYAMADAFLITLKKDPIISYTLPGKVQSYMATGKAILAAIDGETADIIRESQCGLCAPSEDYLAFASNIIQFAMDKENHRKYGDCSKSYYDRYFSSKSFMNHLLTLLQ